MVWDVDIVLVEGLMGLFDGVVIMGGLGNGVSVDIVVLIGWLVVLVLDVKG